MFTKSQIIGCAACLVAIAGSPWAAEINKREGLDPSAQAKVDQALAQSYMTQGKFQSLGSQSDCGSVQVGNVTPRPGQLAPREVITVVRGDVINVAKGCGKP
jgi:hypothetical protein